MKIKIKKIKNRIHTTLDFYLGYLTIAIEREIIFGGIRMSFIFGLYGKEYHQMRSKIWRLKREVKTLENQT